MLSVEDIYREMGKNIYICPIDIANFRDNSIDLTASEFAWTSKGEYIYDSDTDTITVPPHETACILTREAIYISGKVGGTYHSRVSLAMQGFGHIGTMLDPEYCGQSLIMLHNTTDTEQKIADITGSEHGVRIVSVVFYYVDTPIYEKGLATPPGHQEKISKIDKQNRYGVWLNDNKWVNNPKNLKARYKEKYEKKFLERKKWYAKKKPLHVRIIGSTIGRLIIKYAAILLIGYITYRYIVNHYMPTESSDWAGIIVAAVVGLAGIIANDLSKSDRR